MSLDRAIGPHARNAGWARTASWAQRIVCHAQQDPGRTKKAPSPATSVLLALHLSLPGHTIRAHAQHAAPVSSAALKAALRAAPVPLDAIALTSPATGWRVRRERIPSIPQQAAAHRVSVAPRVITARQVAPSHRFPVFLTEVFIPRCQALRTAANAQIRPVPQGISVRREPAHRPLAPQDSFFQTPVQRLFLRASCAA